MAVRLAGPRTLLLTLALATGGCAPPTPAPEPPRAPTGASPREPAVPGGERKALGGREARLPVLGGVTLAGQQISTSSLAGRRLVVFFFTPGAPAAETLAPALAALVPERASRNFELLGVALGADATAAARFVERHGLAFPVLDGRDGAQARRLGLESPVAVLAADASGAVVLARSQFSEASPASAEWLTAALRGALRLEGAGAAAVAGEDLLALPEAPDFERTTLDGSRLRLSALRDRAVALVFFLHHCPYCLAALRTLERELAALPETSRPRLVGIEISSRSEAIRPALEEAGIVPFPIVLDAGHGLRDAYGVFGEVPVIVLIDAGGRVVFRSKPGWHEARDPGIIATWLARAAGEPVPMRLPESGYSGSEICGACHPVEYATWAVTPHASAFDTLVTHGAERRDDCVGCHVVGFGAPGGYAQGQSIGARQSDFEDVGCEACHGRGGPHRSPQFLPDAGYSPICASCHDAKHSLGFDYAAFRPRISHRVIAGLDPEERSARYGASAREPVLPEGEFVGSDACQGCHAAEFAIWASSPHARAVESLAHQGRGDDPACQSCHTTGFQRSGGFPAGAPPAAHPDLARVGCEACHGPGSRHVAGDPPTREGILALTEKCGTCVILSICGSCHDDANDPGFAFEVEAHIQRQQHGGLLEAP